MPYKNMVAKRATGLGELSPDQKEYLIEGETLDDDFPFQSIETMAAAWKHHRAAILAEMPEIEHFEGGRVSIEPRLLPWVWWRLESTEPRKQLAGRKPPRDPEELWRTFFGRVVLWKSYEDSATARFETDQEYLKRMKIKTGGEK